MTNLQTALTDYLVDLARAGYRWESGIARYRDLSSGRLVGEKGITKRIDHYNDVVVHERIGNLTDRFVDGKIDLSTWQARMRQELKDAYIVNLQIGRGGKRATTQSDYGRQGGRLRFEYSRLDNMAREIVDGQLSEAQIKMRAQMYAGGPRTAYWDGQTQAMAAADFDEERRLLGVAEHCVDCVGFAAQGWVPLGTLPEPGVGSVCRHNCHCTKKYRERAV